MRLYRFKGNQFSTLVLAGLSWIFMTQAETLPQKKVTPFKLDQIKLLASPFKCAMDRKCSYLLFLDNNRLLYSFRSNCKLSTQGATASTGSVTLIPFYQMHHQRYSVYWTLNNIPAVSTISQSTVLHGDLKAVQISLTSSGLLINFQEQPSSIIPISVTLFTLNGAVARHYTTLISPFESHKTIAFPQTGKSSNIYLCKVVVGNQSFTKLINSNMQ